MANHSARPELKKTNGGRQQQPLKLPTEAIVIQQIKKPRTYMNHSYRDFSKVPASLDDPSDILQMSFPQKVHDILSNEQYSKWIAWQPHGRAFAIHLPLEFERHVSERYFGHKRYSSFLRQLSNHGFKHISTGPDRNCYYHELMLRGLPHLCVFFPAPKDSRRLIPDPENEPNFYEISQKYPLPSGTASSMEQKDHPSRARVSSQALVDDHPNKRQMITREFEVIPRSFSSNSVISRLDMAAAKPLASPIPLSLASSGDVNLQRLFQARIQAEHERRAIESQLLRESALLAALMRSRRL